MTDQVTAIPELAYDCRTDCFLLDTTALKKIIASAANHQTGELETVCTLCLKDRILNPGLYDTQLHGSHFLDGEILAVLLPDEFPEFDRDLQPQLAHDCRQVCIAEDDSHFLIALTVAPQGEVATVCTGCVLDLIENPQKYDGLDIYGTHILTDEILEHLFPADFDDED